MALTIIPVTARRERGEFDLFGAVMESLLSCGVRLLEGDVVVVSSKYVSYSQGRLLGLGSVSVSEEGTALSRRYRLRPELAEAVLRESDLIHGGIPGFVITSGDGIMAPNAGIDKSNVEDGAVVLYPNDPYGTAELLRRRIFLDSFIHVGVIITDSRIMPARVGTTGIAISCAGMGPVADMRSEADLDGRPLKVTFRAVADGLATAANHVMGEGAESRPIAIVRDSGARLTDRTIDPGETAVPHGQCIYVRGLGGVNEMSGSSDSK